MKMTKWIKALFVGACVVALAGCHATHKPDQSEIDNANEAYSDGAQSSGAGENAGFGDEGGASAAQQGSSRVYYFDYDSSEVRSEYMPAISKNAAYLSSHPRARVIVEGHTDPRGSREYNIGLGERRAKAVAMILVGKGVNRSQLRVVSYGAEKAGAGRNESAYQQDRRVVLLYIQK
ncbi:MAG TPA: OmpA family protein [Gammaproteobacteria bacterium]|nr:OmpA family protein [Gammaproteobacteria bacterium]